MEKVARYVGLDVHKESITIAVADGSGGESSVVGKIPNQWQALSKTLKRLGPSQALFVCYEAGPCGYGLYRRLSAAGYFCMVVAPSMIPKAAGDRVKNDRRDAKKLARLFRSGDLVAVWVPDEESEAVRDLIRARDDAKKAERVTRQQLGKFLLRHGRRFPGKTSWSVKHLEWIRTQRFEQQAQQLTFLSWASLHRKAARVMMCVASASLGRETNMSGVSWWNRAGPIDSGRGSATSCEDETRGCARRYADCLEGTKKASRTVCTPQRERETQTKGRHCCRQGARRIHLGCSK